MRFFLISALSLFLTSSITAQTISGKVQQAEDPNPAVIGATVYVTVKGANKMIATSTTDDFGLYKLKFEPEAYAAYTVHVKSLGFIEYEETVSSTSFPLTLNISVKSDAKQMREVEINAVRARAVVKDDTVIYDAKAFKTHKDANVEDLVTKMPGITKEGGEVKAYGEKVQKVLVDGQEFFGEDANIALKNLPAETVDKVEIYDAMNDRNSFTGFNDGNTTKTMNLRTKAGKNKGQFGKAYAGYGTADRFQGGGNYNYYNGSKRISMLGMANNINNLNFSTSELVGAMTGSGNMGGAAGAGMMRGMSFGMSVSGAGGRRGGMGGAMSNFTVSNQDGVNHGYSFGLNYNDIWGANKKLRTTMSYFGNRTDNFTQSEIIRRNLINTANTLNTDQFDISNSESYNHKFTSRMDGELDSKNSFVWTNKLNFTDNNSRYNTNMINFFTEGITTLKNRTNTNSISFTTDFNTNFLYKLKLNKSGRTFSVNTLVDINAQNGTSDQLNATTRNNTETNFGLNYDTKQWTTTVTNIFTYTEPSGKYGQWLINYSPSLSNRKNDRLVNMYSNFNPTPVLADSLSSKFNNDLFYNTGGVSYRLQYSKWRIMFGSNVQNINFKGNQNYPNSSDLTRDFFGILPYFNLQFSPQKMTKLRLTYNTSLNVPSVVQVQPVLDLSNPTSVYKGNQNLSSEYSHNLFFHYMKPDIVKGTFLIFVSNLNYSNSKISNFSYSTVNDTMIDNVSLRKGVTYSKYVNMENSFSGFLFANYTIPIKKLKSNLSTNGNYSYNQTPSMINFQENMTKTSMYSMGMMLTSNINENVDFSVSYNPKYFSNTFSLAGLGQNNYWTHTAAATTKFTLFKNFVWSSDFSYNYNSQIDPSLNQHIFLLGSSLAYKLLKNRQLEAKITVFDIFNQNQNISRSISNTSITDSRINAMNRYGIFTLTYNFKKFEGRDPDKNSGGFFKMMAPGQ
jgi:hypothetical protein